MTRTVDLIADVGEGFGSWTMGRDEDLIPCLTSANVACGFHAGDPLIMERTVGTCLAHGVRIGAHPGFRDLAGFGRRAMEVSADELRTDTMYQIGALAGFVRAAGGTLAHVSPHGRLGNLVVSDEAYARPVLAAVAAVDDRLVVAAQEGVLTRLAPDYGLTATRIGFPDRAIDDDGSLVSRRLPGAVLHDPEEIAARAVQLVVEGTLTSVHGATVSVPCESVLLHGDNAASVAAARLVRTRLEEAGVTIAAFDSRA